MHEGNGSAVIEAMREAKDLAWNLWWAHVTGPARADVRRADQLWREFEEAAAVFHGELEARAQLSTGKCGQLYEAGSEEQAFEPDRRCHRCHSLEQLLAVADRLVAWRSATEATVSAPMAAMNLLDIIDRAEQAATLARRA